MQHASKPNFKMAPKLYICVCKCSPLFLAGNYSNQLLIVTLLLLAGDVEINPGPEGSSFPCGLCEIDANWSN